MSPRARRLAPHDLVDLLSEVAPTEPLPESWRRTVSERLGPDGGTRRHLDAYDVERAGRPETPFTWSPRRARRILGRLTLAGRTGEPLERRAQEVVADQLARAATSMVAPQSLAAWLAEQPAAVQALCAAEAQGWALELVEAARALGAPWRLARTDAFYDVAEARVSLRGRRDLLLEGGAVARLRAGAPGPHAGAGLRADLAALALADGEGRAPGRLLGIWPEAGVVLCLEADLEQVRRGLHDLVAAGTQARRRLALAA